MGRERARQKVGRACGAATTIVAPRRVGPARRIPDSACRAARICAARAEAIAPVPRIFCFYVDRAGRQHFNFAQQVWLQPGVDMAVTGVVTVALETLALNVLAHVMRECDLATALGIAPCRAARLTRQFCLECLLTAGQSGWKIPRETVRSWLLARVRPGS